MAFSAVNCSHDACVAEALRRLTFTISVVQADRLRADKSKVYEIKAGEGLTATCVTASTSASAEPLNCCGLWMTSSFLETLLALPCIINNYETPLSWIPNKSGQSTFQVKENPGKTLEKSEVCSLAPAFSECSDCVESEACTPSLRRLPLLHSVVLLGGVKHPHTHTQNEAIRHTIHLYSDTGPTKANKRWTFLQYYSEVGGLHALCRQLK